MAKTNNNDIAEPINNDVLAKRLPIIFVNRSAIKPKIGAPNMVSNLRPTKLITLMKNTKNADSVNTPCTPANMRLINFTRAPKNLITPLIMPLIIKIIIFHLKNLIIFYQIKIIFGIKKENKPNNIYYSK